MKHWTLHISPNQIRPLLEQPTIEKLQDDYLDKMKATYTEWLKNLLNLEMRDWKSPTNKPEMDENQKFQTTAPKGVWYFQNKWSKKFFQCCKSTHIQHYYYSRSSFEGIIGTEICAHYKASLQ